MKKLSLTLTLSLLCMGSLQAFNASNVDDIVQLRQKLNTLVKIPRRDYEYELMFKKTVSTLLENCFANPATIADVLRILALAQDAMTPVHHDSDEPAPISPRSYLAIEISYKAFIGKPELKEALECLHEAAEKSK
ncbi:MAG TPA: hypothetical protein VLG71_02495 [Candidatus Limnocylindria bacterium]|nr:hypothetical protein [Candidatus Limnocylindria bacterium]